MFQLKIDINETVIDISQIHGTTSSLQIQLTSFMITKNHECENYVCITTIEYDNTPFRSDDSSRNEKKMKQTGENK